ncbi:MAG TPA: nodulation protein NfeD [Candidatus Dormibacteraeota bacterium]|nr:nodulation protein NfeD [Candidatus Dormibacteraeota bacterium]
MKRAGRLFLAAVMLAAFVPAVPARAAEPHVLLATLNGVINPITDNYISNAVDKAVADGSNALIIQMDTPGGLDTSMRDIIKKMLGARVPVVIFVSPSGARAASAGMYITEAADIAVMAPGTNIGSAHPVSIGGSNPAPNPSGSPGTAATAAPDIESIKIENDAAAYARALATLHHHNADWVEKAVRQSINAPADDAVKLGVVDFESRDLDTLLADLDGRQVIKGGHTYTLQTAHAGIERYDLSGFDQLLQAIADPNLVYLLFLLAIIGIAFWVTHPGLVLPGVVGVIAGLLAALSLFNLPINIAGVLLILLAFLLFIIDLKAVTHGVLTTGGIIAMTLGGLLLIDTGFLSEGINIALLLITVLVIAGIFLFILQKVIVARRRPYAAGEESMVGSIGSVREPLDPTGMVFVQGALWRASSRSGTIPAGTKVRVIAVEGLRLEVEALSREEPTNIPGPQAASS